MKFAVPALLLSLLLSACATAPAPEAAAISAPVDWQSRELALSDFHVTGGLGIWTDTENLSSRMSWAQQADDFNIELTAPAGLSSLHLSRSNGDVTLVAGGAEPVHGTAAGSMLQRVLGLSVEVPVDQLSLWLRGLPGAAVRSSIDPQGVLRDLEYTDSSGTNWYAVFRKYTELDEIRVPALITASGGPYNIRIVLKNWQRGSSLVDSEPAAPEKAPERLRVPGR